MKLGIIKEGKTPPDMRVPLSPAQCKLAQNTFTGLEVMVQKSPIRIFQDDAYVELELTVTEDVSACDVLMGVKEVPIEQLIPSKTYFFFSHTIKEQPYNRKLLQAILAKNIRLIDWETLTDKESRRILGFGKYAGIVGTYNGFRAWGKRYGTFELKPAHACLDRVEMESEYKKIHLPAIKIALTGKGRVASGAIEVLNDLNIQQVSVEDYLSKTFNHPVYAQFGVEDYNKRKDGQPATQDDFFQNFHEYESAFMKIAEVTDLFIAGHFYAEGSPYLFTREDAKKAEFKIKVVADISCDIDGPVASTIKPSTIENPIYGYDPKTETEADFQQDDVITVMAVDNLPCELPKDASEDFGKEVLNQVLPQFFNGDKDEILERATMTKDGKLTPKYAYLQDYVDGK